MSIPWPARKRKLNEIESDSEESKQSSQNKRFRSSMTQSTQDIEGMDLHTWLKSKDLEPLCPKLSAANFSLQALLQCSEQDIRDLCTEFQWSAIQRIKLTSALKSTAGAALNVSQQKIIYLGNEEKEILDGVYRKHEVLSEDMHEVQRAINGLEKSALECTQEIHQKHDVLIAMLEKKKCGLLRTVQTLKEKRKKELNGILQKLQATNQMVVDAQTECKNAALKPDISSASRLQQMTAALKKQQSMEQKLDLDAHEVEDFSYQLAVHFDQNAFDANFKSMFDVGFNHEMFALKELAVHLPRILSFSTSADYKGPNLELSDNNRCVKRINGVGHTYILADVEPVTKGIHCWRISTKNPKPGWIMWGIGDKKKYNGSSQRDNLVQGIAPAGPHYYNHGGAQTNNHTLAQFNAKQLDVDMCLNLNEQTLNFCVVGQNDEQHTVVFTNVPLLAQGYVPHFNIHGQDIEIRIAKIPPEWFGIQKKNIFV